MKKLLKKSLILFIVLLIFSGFFLFKETLSKTTVSLIPAFIFEKSGPNFAVNNTVGEYTIRIVNNTGSQVSNVEVIDYLPFGETFVSGWPPPVFIEPPSINGQKIKWFFSTFNANSSTVINYKVLYSNPYECRDLTNIATLYVNSVLQATASFTTRVCAMPDEEKPGEGKEEPKANPVEINLVGIKDKLCLGESLSLSFTINGGEPPFSYSIDFGDDSALIKGTQESRSLVVSHNYTQLKRFPILVIVSDKNKTTTVLSTTVEIIDCSVPDILVYHHNFFVGYPDNTFKPDGKITRAEIAAAVSRALALGWSYEDPGFKDVLKSHWAIGFISLMKQHKFMDGSQSGFFRPDEPITRAEAAQVFLRVLGFSPIQVKETETPEYFTRAEFAVLVSDVLGREIKNTTAFESIENVVNFKDVDRNYWAYNYILEVSTPHLVLSPVRLERTIRVGNKIIPLFTEGDKSIVKFLKIGEKIKAIVSVDGLDIFGEIPKPREIIVKIIDKEKP